MSKLKPLTKPCAAALLLMVLSAVSFAQPMAFDDVRSKAEPLSAESAQSLVKGSHVEFRLVGGSVRRWTHEDDGTFIASSTVAGGPVNGTARGTWKISEKGEYCVTFNWTYAGNESWCRFLYPVEDRYYAFNALATKGTRSGAYYFKK